VSAADVRVADRFGCTPPERDLVVRAAAAAAAFAGRAALPVSLLLTDAAEIARLHGEFLADPAETDVMSFALDGGVEVVANVQRAGREAQRRGVTRADELALYVVHGVLHACGFDDVESADRRRMREAEHAVLGALGVRVAPVD
jgi:probable rRNA maturation factor